MIDKPFVQRYLVSSMERPEPLTNILMGAYNRMLQHFGPRHWWPADSPLEVIVGAILTQNTAWTNVEKAIENIKSAGALSINKLLGTPVERLAAWIRPSGYFNLKARRLQAAIRFIAETYESDLERMTRASLSTLRKQLLGVYGIGEETADSILLYALGKPVFVVDAYTRRILSRHHLIGQKTTYGEIQQLFIGALPKEVPLFNEYHALIVETGKTFCRRTPLCSDCPLYGWHVSPAGMVLESS